MNAQGKQLIDTVIENHDIIHNNLEKVQEILTDSLAGNNWDRIIAIGMAGKLLDICRKDIETTKKYVQDVKEESNDINTGTN